MVTGFKQKQLKGLSLGINYEWLRIGLWFGEMRCLHLVCTVACESIHAPWHFSYFVALQPGIKIDYWGIVSFDLHNMPATLKMQNISYFETNKTKKLKT